MPTDSERFLAAVEAHCVGLEAVTPGCRGPECEYAEDDPDPADHRCEPSFGRAPCDSCGSTLAGDREPGTALLRQAGGRPLLVIDLELCVDCVAYHANGDVPETWEG